MHLKLTQEEILQVLISVTLISFFKKFCRKLINTVIMQEMQSKYTILEVVFKMIAKYIIIFAINHFY